MGLRRASRWYSSRRLPHSHDRRVNKCRLRDGLLGNRGRGDGRYSWLGDRGDDGWRRVGANFGEIDDVFGRDSEARLPLVGIEDPDYAETVQLADYHQCGGRALSPGYTHRY